MFRGLSGACRRMFAGRARGSKMTRNKGVLVFLVCVALCGVVGLAGGEGRRGRLVSAVPQPRARSKARESQPFVQARGGRLFALYGCNACHSIDGSQSAGPSLWGIYGTRVKLKGGRSVLRDEHYIRMQILQPGAMIVEGYANVQPSYLGRISEPELDALVAFLRSLRTLPKPKTKPKHKKPKVRGKPAKRKAISARLSAYLVRKRGELLYRANCQLCHGHSGSGDGAAARGIIFKMTDFSKGQYRYGSSPMAIFRTISQGRQRALMPSWSHLAAKDRWALVHYLRSLKKRARMRPPKPR